MTPSLRFILLAVALLAFIEPSKTPESKPEPMALSDLQDVEANPSGTLRLNCRFIGGVHSVDRTTYRTCVFQNAKVSGDSVAENSVFRNCDTSGLRMIIDGDILTEDNSTAAPNGWTERMESVEKRLSTQESISDPDGRVEKLRSAVMDGIIDEGHEFRQRLEAIEKQLSTRKDAK